MANEEDLHPQKEKQATSKPSTMDQIRPYLDKLSQLVKESASVASAAWVKAKPTVIQIIELFKEWVIKLWLLGKEQYHKYIDKKTPPP